MNDKVVRYLAVGVGALVTLAILYLNGGSFVHHGLFASKIKYTMVFHLLKTCTKVFVSSSTAGDWAYLLWFACLGGGVFLSWKSRFKTAGVLAKVIKTIHEKA